MSLSQDFQQLGPVARGFRRTRKRIQRSLRRVLTLSDLSHCTAVHSCLGGSRNRLTMIRLHLKSYPTCRACQAFVPIPSKFLEFAAQQRRSLFRKENSGACAKVSEKKQSAARMSRRDVVVNLSFGSSLFHRNHFPFRSLRLQSRFALHFASSSAVI